MLVRALGFAFIGASLSLGACSDPSASERPSKKVTAEIQSQTQTGKITLIFVGFHNSESDPFSPAPIGYVGMDYDAAINAAEEYARDRGYIVLDDTKATEHILANIPEDRIFDIVDTSLILTNEWLQSGDKTCPNCEDFEGFKLAETQDFILWDDRQDKIVILAGLETLSPNNYGLRSGMGAFVFTRSGKYIDHSFIEYNFSNYLTDDFQLDLIAIVDAISK